MITPVIKIVVDCFPLTDEPLEGAWSYACNFGSAFKADFWLWYPTFAHMQE